MNDKAQQALQEYREKVANGEIIKESKTPKQLHKIIYEYSDKDFINILTKFSIENQSRNGYADDDNNHLKIKSLAEAFWCSMVNVIWKFNIDKNYYDYNHALKKRYISIIKKFDKKGKFNKDKIFIENHFNILENNLRWFVNINDDFCKNHDKNNITF